MSTITQQELEPKTNDNPRVVLQCVFELNYFCKHLTVLKIASGNNFVIKIC